jgi:hypothetical protein
MLMKKQLITMVLCLILFMTHQAYSSQELEDAHERAVDRIHRQHFHNQENVRESTECCHTSCLNLLPCNWSRRSMARVNCVIFYSLLFGMDYLMMEAQKLKCMPLITCAEFGGSATVFNECKSTTPKDAFRSKDQILLNLTSVVINDNYIDCLYKPKFEYEHTFQSCSEIHGSADNLLTFRSNLFPEYLFWKKYAFKYMSWFIFGFYTISFLL